MGENFNWPWFINNLWERENAQGMHGIEGRGGYRNGKYYPYTATNGVDVGPGFDMQFQSEAFRKKATQGFTKQELDDSLRTTLEKELPYIRQRIIKEGGNPNAVTNEVLAGLLDIYHNRHNGLYQDFPKLWKAVAANDYEGMQRESRTGYYIGSRNPENWHWDDSRWNFRKENYFKAPQNGTVSPPSIPISSIVEQPDALRVAKPVVPDIKEDGGWLSAKTFDALSLPEQARVIKFAVGTGITNLKDIKQAYKEFAEGGTVGELVDAIYQNHPREEFMGEPDHHYDFTQSEEWANQHGYYPDARGHRDDRVKKPAHPSHPSRGAWNGNTFMLTEKGMDNPNYTLFGLNDGGQDPQAIITYKDSYVLPEFTVTPKGNYINNPYDNIRLHLKAGGGNLQGSLVEAALYGDGGKITYGKPYYSYDEDGRKVEGVINYNGNVPEVVVVPDSQLSPEERNYRERQRQKTFADYDAQRDKELTALQSMKAQKEWEDSPQKKALDYGMAAAQGIGMGADIVSTALGGLPVYSALKGAQTLDRAASTGDAMDYVDAGLWLSPMLTVGGRQVYKAAKPAVESVFRKGTPAAEWADIGHNTQFSIGNVEGTGSLPQTQTAAERGRKKLLNWVKSPFYRQRVEDESFYREANNIVTKMGSMIEETPFDYSFTREQLSPTGTVLGKTGPKQKNILYEELPDGSRIYDTNLDLGISIGSDIGEAADDTALHELLHYITANSKGMPEVTANERLVDRGWFKPVEIWNDLIGRAYRPRGAKWQGYILDQNNSLLPKYSYAIKESFENPGSIKKLLMESGKSAQEAEGAIGLIKDRYGYLYDIQEQRAHLQEMFVEKVMPNLKNPNDAAEIEAYLVQHPELMSSGEVGVITRELRPGSIRDYAKYFSSALGTIPFINNSN